MEKQNIQGFYVEILKIVVMGFFTQIFRVKGTYNKSDKLNYYDPDIHLSYLGGTNQQLNFLVSNFYPAHSLFSPVAFRALG